MVVEDGCFSAALMESNIVSVSDMVSETSERLEFRDAVVKMSIGEVLLGASGMYKGCVQGDLHDGHATRLHVALCGTPAGVSALAGNFIAEWK